MTLRYRYTRWDGTQELPDLDPDNILDNLTDDLMNFGDLQHALRNLLQRGMQNPFGDRTQGLRDLLQQLRQQRRQQLDQFNRGSMFDQLQEQLDEIIDMERNTIDRRLDEAMGGQQDQQGGQPQSSQQGDQQSGDQQGQQSGQQQGQQGMQQPGQRGQQGMQQAGQRGQQQQGGQQGQTQSGRQGEEGQSGERGGEQGQQGEGNSPGDMQQFAEMLEQIANRKRDFLDQLPGDVPGQVRELQNYEFMDKEAEARFNELLESLKQAMMQTFFKDLSKMIQDMSPDDMQRMKDMVQDLNKMIQDRMAGNEPNFDEFMQKYGDMFGDNPPQNLDQLLEQMQQQMSAMQSLLNSLDPEMRRQLSDLLADKIGDPQLQQALDELAMNMEYLFPMQDMSNQYNFRGEEEIDLQSAMRLMEHMQDLDDLERQIERTQYGGDVEDIDVDKLEDILGPEARETVDQLKQLLEILEEAGYIRKKGNAWELTPRGTRKIGQRALGEIYPQLKKDSFGKHEIRDAGRGGERVDDSKPYEFGDPFYLDIQKTIMNSMYREGPHVPAHLHPDDFEVNRTELRTQTATVIMLDLSWSMALRGSFQAAKRVAMALNNLISSQ
jgi:uncharacterized protein with von Willebrand factor type A (vWA) domain